MRTILVADGADNPFAASDELLAVVFPSPGRDVEFIEDARARTRADGVEPDLADRADRAFAQMWRRLVLKRDVRGIDGIPFHELACGRRLYPDELDSGPDRVGRGFFTRSWIGDRGFLPAPS